MNQETTEQAVPVWDLDCKNISKKSRCSNYAKSDGLEKGTCITILFPKETKYTQK